MLTQTKDWNMTFILALLETFCWTDWNCQILSIFTCQSFYCFFDTTRNRRPFSLDSVHADVKSTESGKWKEVNMQRLSPRFRPEKYFVYKISEDFRTIVGRNVLPKFIDICTETPYWCPSGWPPTWRTETSRNIFHRVVLQKREIFLEELTNIIK